MDKETLIKELEKRRDAADKNYDRTDSDYYLGMSTAIDDTVDLIGEYLKGYVIEPEEPFRSISQHLKTQDNRITADPIFVVQRLVRDYGYDSGYSDEYIWADCDDDYSEADEKEAEKLECDDANCCDLGSWTKVYYKDRWEFVTACFTEKGCHDYLNINGHNLGKTRIYAESGYRNNEWISLRKAMLQASKESE